MEMRLKEALALVAGIIGLVSVVLPWLSVRVLFISLDVTGVNLITGSVYYNMSSFSLIPAVEVIVGIVGAVVALTYVAKRNESMLLISGILMIISGVSWFVTLEASKNAAISAVNSMNATPTATPFASPATMKATLTTALLSISVGIGTILMVVAGIIAVVARFLKM